MNRIYYITVYPHYGGRKCFETDRDINEVIDFYENMWDYVIVRDTSQKEIYRTYGIENFLKAHGYAENTY